MNKAMFACFIAFWMVVVSIVSLDSLTSGSAQEIENSPGRTITMAEFEQHNAEGSCWKLIRGKVYDVTEFIRQHPSRPAVMLEWCGKESTQAMEDKGYGRPHSDAAWELLEEYLIGTLVP